MEVSANSLYEFFWNLPDMQKRIYIILSIIFAVCLRKKNIKSCLKYYLVWFIVGYLIFYLAYSITFNMYYNVDTYIMISKSLIFRQFERDLPLIADSVFLLFIFQHIYRHPSANTLIFYILSVLLFIIYEYVITLIAPNIVYIITIKLLSPIYNLFPDTIIRF